MAKITKVIGTRLEENDNILIEFKELMENSGLNQSQLLKLLLYYVFKERKEEFRAWMIHNTICF